LKKICFIQPTYPTFFRIWNLNHIFFVMFKIDQKNANQLGIFFNYILTPGICCTGKSSYRWFHKTFDERFLNFILKLASLLQSAKVHIEILKPVCKQKTYNFPYWKVSAQIFWCRVFFFLFPLHDFYFCFPSPRHLSNGPPLTEKPHLTMAAPPSFSL
jgi:hypothetical protein